MNGVENGINVSHHFAVGEAQDMKTLAFEIGCTPKVVSYSLIGRVLAAVDFDDKPRPEAAEIGNVSTDRNLASEMRAAYWQAIS